MALSVCFALNVFGVYFPPILPTGGEQTGPLAIRVLAGLGSRALVLLPSILLLAFTSRRHSALFQLREEYSHKYNIAASVNGFKQQAPDYEQPIAAAVFLELLKNPASSLVKNPEETDNDILSTDLIPNVVKTMNKLRNPKTQG